MVIPTQTRPGCGRRLCGLFYDLKNAEKINKGEIKDLAQLGVKAKDDLTLEFTLEGPRGYFPVLMAYAATAPAHRATVEKHGDKWTEPEHIVCNGIFTLESWDHNKQFTLKKNPTYFEKDRITEKVVRPVIARQAQLLPTKTTNSISWKCRVQISSVFRTIPNSAKSWSSTMRRSPGT